MLIILNHLLVLHAFENLYSLQRKEEERKVLISFVPGIQWQDTQKWFKVAPGEVQAWN